MKLPALIAATTILCTCIVCATVLTYAKLVAPDFVTHTISAVVGGILGMATLGNAGAPEKLP